jgi:hypothetical protein
MNCFIDILQRTGVITNLFVSAGLMVIGRPSRIELDSSAKILYRSIILPKALVGSASSVIDFGMIWVRF